MFGTTIEWYQHNNTDFRLLNACDHTWDVPLTCDFILYCPVPVSLYFAPTLLNLFSRLQFYIPCVVRKDTFSVNSKSFIYYLS